MFSTGKYGAGNEGVAVVSEAKWLDVGPRRILGGPA